jgi:hypothetical protein
MIKLRIKVFLIMVLIFTLLSIYSPLSSVLSMGMIQTYINILLNTAMVWYIDFIFLVRGLLGL